MNIYSEEITNFISTYKKMSWDVNSLNILPESLLKYRPSIVRKFILHNISECICKTCGKDISEKLKTYAIPLYCNMSCYKKDSDAQLRINKIKTEMYKNPEIKSRIEAKKMETNMKKLGVPHPMQNPVCQEKQVRSSFKGKKVDGMTLQGYEPFVYSFLKNFPYSIIRGNQFLEDQKITLSWKDDNGKYHTSFPDFFVPELNSFIEVKSTYTLEKGKYKIQKAIETAKLHKMGYIIAVYTPRVGITLEHFNHSYILDPE